MRKRYVLVFIVGVMAIYFMLWLPKSIDESIDGIIYKLDDASISINATIKVKGRLHKDVFLKETFKGRIEVDKLETILAKELLNQLEEHDNKYIEQDLNRNVLNLTYIFFDPSCNAMRHLSIGSLFVEDKFKNLTLTIYDENKSWDSDTGWVFSGPAVNRNQAYDLGKVITGYDLD